MRLTTNRNADPNDILLADRDGRDGRLPPRAEQGGPKSKRGKARAAWAAEAKTDEDHPLELLAHLHFDIAYDLDRLRRDVSSYDCQRPPLDRAAVVMGADWVSKQVIAGHRRLSLDDIQSAITALDLRAGLPWTTVSVATITHDELCRAGGSEHRLGRPHGRRNGVDTDRNQRRLRLGTTSPPTFGRSPADSARTSASWSPATCVRRPAFSGAELRRVRGFEVGVRQGDQLWTGEEPITNNVISHTERHCCIRHGDYRQRRRRRGS